MLYLCQVGTVHINALKQTPPYTTVCAGEQLGEHRNHLIPAHHHQWFRAQAGGRCYESSVRRQRVNSIRVHGTDADAASLRVALLPPEAVCIQGLTDLQ